jgi:hypothetical protein
VGWAPAVGTISSLLAKINGISPDLTATETGALNQLAGLGAAGNPYAPAVGNVASTLLAGGGPDRSGMINDAYAQYRSELNPFLQASFLDPRNTPGFSDALNVVNSDITNQINGQFAAAGRDLSGMNTQALARGLAQGEGTLIANQYNQNAARQLEAANAAFGAGGTTAGILSGLDQTRLTNMQAGIPAAQQAVQAQISGPLLELQAEAQRRGIPLETLAAQMGISLPAGRAFGTTSGDQSGTATTSVPLGQQIIGGFLEALGSWAARARSAKTAGSILEAESGIAPRISQCRIYRRRIAGALAVAAAVASGCLNRIRCD